MKGPERFETERLILRKPVAADAGEVFARYASDSEVTRYMGWPRHFSIEDTKAFLSFSDAEWIRWPAGPYLIESRPDKKLVGSTGFGFETPAKAATGYVLAREEWGKGYATEALAAMVRAAAEIGIRELYALCHPEHLASIRVLEKCGFRLKERLEKFASFPNLHPGQRGDCLYYVRTFPA